MNIRKRWQRGCILSVCGYPMPTRTLPFLPFLIRPWWSIWKDSHILKWVWEMYTLLAWQFSLLPSSYRNSYWFSRMRICSCRTDRNSHCILYWRDSLRVRAGADPQGVLPKLGKMPLYGFEVMRLKFILFSILSVAVGRWVRPSVSSSPILPFLRLLTRVIP